MAIAAAAYIALPDLRKPLFAEDGLVENLSAAFFFAAFALALALLVKAAEHHSCSG